MANVLTPHTLQAKEAYRHIISLKHDFAAAYSNLATILKNEATGDTKIIEESSTLFEQSIKHDQSLAAAHLGLINTLNVLGKYVAIPTDSI